MFMAPFRGGKFQVIASLSPPTGHERWDHEAVPGVSQGKTLANFGPKGLVSKFLI